MQREYLVKGRWYRGLNRFIGGIALWTGQHFVGFQLKFGYYLETSMEFNESIHITPLETE